MMDSQLFILGPKVEEFEQAICQYTGSPHAVGVSSGTDALLAILMALGVGPGCAVITTPYTFFATAGGISRVGAEPVFVDIEPDTCNISVEKLADCLAKCSRNSGGQLLSRCGNVVSAIMPVHLFGQCARMDEVMELAGRFELPVIEDAAQALGTTYPAATGALLNAGAIGEFGYFSFFPSKNLGAFGDAGMVVCRDEEMASRMRSLRNHGMEERYFHPRIGGNFRLDAMQAAVLLVKLPHLEDWSAARISNAQFYRDEIHRRGLLDYITPPAAPSGSANSRNHTYNQFVARAARREDLCRHLTEHEIGWAIYYPVPLHLQECFASIGCAEGDFPEAEKAARETLALPIYPELTRDQQRRVVEVIAEFYER